MSETIRLSDRAELLADIDAASGDLVRLHDRKLNLDIIEQPPGVLTAWRQMVRFAQCGKRLNWSSFTPFDLASGYVHWNPVAGGTDNATMLKYAADPMNQLVVKLVRERGVREVVGITDGVSRLGDTLVTIPAFRGPLPLALNGLAGVRRLRKAGSAQTVEITRDRQLGDVLQLEGGAAYEVCL